MIETGYNRLMNFLGPSAIILGLNLLASNGKAQALDYSTFISQVIDNHPVIQRAELYPQWSEAALFRAKGGFDAKIYTEHYGKNFNGKNYFQYTEAGIKIPSWAGLELKGAYNLASGYLLNPENTLPEFGQASIGVLWSLGQGLMLDERRAGLRIARAGLEMAKAQRLALRNDLLLEAAKAYWNWNYYDNAKEIAIGALRQAQIRHEGLRQSFFQGERAAMDTLESFILVQNRKLELEFSMVDAQNASVALTAYLWKEGTAISPDALPSAPLLLNEFQKDTSLVKTEYLIQNAKTNHPEIKQYQIKIRQLSIEKQLKKENRKPVIDLSYNILGNSWQFFPTAAPDGPAMVFNNVKWGLDVSYPILNRKANGDWQMIQIKIDQAELELREKQQAIAVKVNQYANDVTNLRKQVMVFRDILANYKIILDGENEKFSIGESSVFLVNAREQRWLDTQLKYLKLVSELQKAEVGLQWATGILGQ